VYEGSIVTPLNDLATRKELKTCYRPSVALSEPEVGAQREFDANEQFRYVAQRVEKLRGLPYRSQLLPVYVTDKEIRERLRSDLYATYPRRHADQEEIILRMLGAVRGGPLDLRLLTLSSTASNVLGLYLAGTKELLVRYLSDTEWLSAAEEAVLAHEAEHALADQAFGLPGNLRVRMSKRDERTAWSAVIEGDAQITAAQYVRSSMTPQRRAEYRNDDELEPVPVVRGASPSTRSPYLITQGAFPYAAGERFVCSVYLRGGWDAVDKLYKDPPKSTAEILYPSRYENGEEAEDPRDPRVPSGWKEAPLHDLGALDLLLLFEAPGAYKNRSMTEPFIRASAWNGGEVHVYRRGPRTAMAVDLVEHPDAVLPLCASFNALYRVSFPIERELTRQPHERFAIENRWGAAVLRCRKDEVRLAVAPQVSLAHSLAR
jgi:hypothetical protein